MGDERSRHLEPDWRAERQAFVAMKYSSDPWRNKVYRVISECLREANITPIRADEIGSSAGSADEVLDLLRRADIVVIDTTGDSLSVAYELGYCHGIAKNTESVTLLRKRSEGENGFAYRHYRCLYYDNLRHLRRLIRERFAMSRPLHDDQYGMAIHLRRDVQGESDYGAQAVNAILDTLAYAKFSGRCECYAVDGVFSGEANSYIMGLGLMYSPSGRVPSYRWWEKFVDRLQARLGEQNSSLVVDEDLGRVAKAVVRR